MTPTKPTLRILVIDTSPARSSALLQALESAGYQVVALLHSHQLLREQIERHQPDVILIDMESPDRDTLESLHEVHCNQPRPIVMFSDANDSALIEAAVQAGVSAYVVDGMQPHRLRPIIEVAIARFREFQALRDELQQTRNKLAERREIEKAKGILMKQKGMAEEDAYQALRKLAMDQGLKIGEVARQLISIAKLLG